MQIQMYTKRPQDQSRLVEGPNSSNEGMVSIPLECNGNPSNPASPFLDTDLNIHIAIRKDTRSCTKHP